MKKIFQYITIGILLIGIYTSTAFALEIKKDTIPVIYVVLVDATDGYTAETSITAPTVYYVKQGGSATNLVSPTWAELDAVNMPGLYSLALTAGMTDTAGNLIVYITKAGCRDFRASIDIVANLEVDSYARLGEPAGASMSADIAAVKSDTGAILTDTSAVDTSTELRTLLTGSDTAVSTYAGGAVASVTGAVASVTGSIGSISGVTFPTNFGVLSISATTGLVDITQTAADKVWGTTARALTDKANFTLASGEYTNIWSVATRTLTAGTNIALAKGTGITGFNDIAASDILTTPANKLATNVSGYVTTTHSFPTNFSSLSIDASGRVSVYDIINTALAKFFSVNSGTTYSSAVAGSVVKEIVDNAGGGSAPTVEEIRVEMDTNSTKLQAISDATDGDTEGAVYTGIEKMIRIQR